MHLHYLHRFLAAIWPLLSAGLFVGMLFGFGHALGAAIIPYHVCHQGFTIPDFFWLRAETILPFAAGATCLAAIHFGGALKKRFTLHNVQPIETNLSDD